MFVNRCSRDLSTYISYTTVCPPVRGDNPRALASGFSPLKSGINAIYL